MENITWKSITTRPLTHLMKKHLSLAIIADARSFQKVLLDTKRDATRNKRRVSLLKDRGVTLRSHLNRGNLQWQMQELSKLLGHLLVKQSDPKL